MKSPAAKHTFNYIITLEIVFVQSIAGINCGSTRLVWKKKEGGGQKKKLVPTMTEQTFAGMKKGQENKMKAEAAGLVRRLAAASSTLRSVHFARNRGVRCRRAKKDKEPFLNPLVFYILGVIPPPLGFASEQNLSNIFQILNTFVTRVSTE